VEISVLGCDRNTMQTTTLQISQPQTF
jgi:hypothetical protein